MTVSTIIGDSEVNVTSQRWLNLQSLLLIAIIILIISKIVIYIVEVVQFSQLRKYLCPYFSAAMKCYIEAKRWILEFNLSIN